MSSPLPAGAAGKPAGRPSGATQAAAGQRENHRLRSARERGLTRHVFSKKFQKSFYAWGRECGKHVPGQNGQISQKAALLDLGRC